MHVMGSISPANEREGFSLQEVGIAVALPTSPLHHASGFIDSGGTQTRLPPPPPPPPPPMPPLLPALGEPVGGQKKRRVRSFFWKTIPENQVTGRPNLWTQGRVQQQYEIDVRTIEELFGQNDCQSNTKPTASRRGTSRASFREAKEEVSILDSKRGMNIGIFLKQFKRTNQAIVDDIHRGNSEPYGAEPLRELLKLLPEIEEVRKLRSYRGNVSQLSLADSFMYLLIQLPSYAIRIESMLLKEEFPVTSEAVKRHVGTLRAATEELMCCEELHAVLHLVLQAGNILNAGGHAGNAVGFKLSSLLSLADTKANKPGMNLLHFVALEAKKKDAKLLEFPVRLSHVAPAARISVETLDADLHWLTSRTRSVEDNAQKDTELLQQLGNFLQSAASCLSSLHSSRQQLRKEGGALIDFFCEDHETFRLDDCFSIFHTFCCRFTAAVKENVEREAKDAARRRQIQKLEEQKRHSWAGAEEVGGAFGLRCSSETDMSAAVSRHSEAGLLVELLASQSNPRSPLISHNPLRHSRSLRRSRKSPSSSPSVAAERQLSTLLGMGTSEHNVSQQSPGVAPQNQQPPSGTMVEKPRSSSPNTSLSAKSTNRATATYLSGNATQTPVNNMDPTKEVKPTCDRQRGYSDTANEPLSLAPSVRGGRSGLTEEPARRKNADEDLGERIGDEVEGGAATTGRMSVVLEKCALVPELKAFDEVIDEGHRRGRRHDDVLITDEEGGSPQDQMPRNNAQIQKPVHISSSQREEGEGQEEKVVVWCVTGVCEAAGELTHSTADDTHAQPDKDQSGSDSQGETSSAAADHTRSEAQRANEKPVPVPISSQPVPATCDPSHPVSSPRWRPTDRASTSKGPTHAARASEEAPETANQNEERRTNEGREAITEQSDDRKRVDTTSCHATNENAEAVPSTNRKSKSASSSKNPPSSKTPPTGVKPVTPNTTSAAHRAVPVRTLTSSENQGMRRVVPISRTNRGAPSLGKGPEKPPGNRGSSTAAAPAGLSVSNLSSTSLRRAERPSTAPSSRRSSVNNPKESNGQKVPGAQALFRGQNQDLQKKPSIRKPSTKPQVPPEEKMCRSTLRALTQGGGSISAPTTPLHKATSSSLPSFARSTASSSFRRTRPLPARSGPTTTSASSPLTRTGSLRVSRSSELHHPTSAPPPSRSQSIRAPPCSSRGSVSPPKGHQRNNSGTLSDKSTHSRDSGLHQSTRPSWR